MSRSERARKAGRLRVRSGRCGNVRVVSPEGELDLATAKALQDELTVAETTDADQIILDLAGLDFIDGTGLQLILTANARSSAHRNRLRLLRGPPQIQRMFEITATVDRLPFADRAPPTPDQT